VSTSSPNERHAKHTAHEIVIDARQLWLNCKCRTSNSGEPAIIQLHKVLLVNNVSELNNEPCIVLILVTTFCLLFKLQNYSCRIAEARALPVPQAAFTRCKLSRASQVPGMGAQTFHASRITRNSLQSWACRTFHMKSLRAHPKNPTRARQLVSCKREQHAVSKFQAGCSTTHSEPSCVLPFHPLHGQQIRYEE
jgi:hypothetical protein